MVEVHYLFLAVVAVDLFRGIYLADDREVTDAVIQYVLGFYPPVLLFYLVLDVAAELAVFASFVGVEEAVGLEN